MPTTLRIAALAAVFCVAASTALAGAPRPNIVLIMLDDMSPIPLRSPDRQEPHTFGAYGGRVYTPNIDRMAAEGIRFDQANVASTICSPSRYSYLTGRYATRSLGPSFTARFPAGVMSRPENRVELDPPGTRPNLPQLLQAAGYRTGMVGKSHLVNEKVLDSPDTWKAAGLRTYAYDADPYDPAVSAALSHNHAKWSEWIKPYGFDFADGIYAANVREQYLAANDNHNLEWTVSKALDFLEGSRDSEQPFFLYFATTMPHGPFPFNKEGGKYPFGLDADIRVTAEGVSWDTYPFMPSRAEIRSQNAAAGFDEDAEYMTWLDAGIGAILQKLREIGADENTLVILTSDHGFWRGGKASLYDGGMRVPMIARWPASGQTGRTYGELISNIDFAPTVLDLAGVTPPAQAQIDGRSYRAVLEGSAAPIQDAVFAELGSARAVKTRKWKYIAVRYTRTDQEKISKGQKFQGYEDTQIDRPYYGENALLGYLASRDNPHYFETDQLYDLEADPQEERNVIAEHPEITAELRGRLTDWLHTFPDRPYWGFTRP